MSTRHSHGHTHTESMLSVEDALDRILAAFEPLEAVRVPIDEASGLALVADVVSDLDVPPLDNSGMDGYAVRADSVAAATPDAPVTLRVIGRVAAGELPTTRVEPGTAVRIMTGAPIPPGADAVVAFEETDEVERRRSGRPLDEVAVSRAVEAGSDIRRAGRDMVRGQTVLRAGTILRPPHIGLLASLGAKEATVRRRPQVAILATGNELVPPGLPLPEGKVYDSNSHGLAAAVTEAGGTPRIIGIARDDMESVHAKLDEGLDSDMLITSAGVSKGDFDMVKDVLAQRGEMQFWSVRMKPAKPLAFGVLRVRAGAGESDTDASTRGVPHLGLPGNPVSALVAFEQFGRAAIARMLGHGPVARPVVRAVLADPIFNTDGRRVYARAVVTRRGDTYHASLTGDQGSNILTSMAEANGLAVCPEDVPVMEAGETVDVLMIRWPPDREIGAGKEKEDR